MRPCRVLGAAVALLPVIMTSPARADPPFAADSSEAGTPAWLPVPEEEIESPELLEEAPGVTAGWIVRGSLSRGRLVPRRAAATLGRGKARAECGLLLDRGRARPGVRLDANGRAEASIGRVSLSRLPPLLADAMRLTRPGGRVPVPDVTPLGADPSRGASAGAIDGGALVLESRARQGLFLDSFAGVRAEGGGRIGGIGAGRVRGGTRIGAFVAMSGDGTQVASLSASRRDRSLRTALEVARGSRGCALLGEAMSRGDGTLVSARWRYRSWAPRRVAAEIRAETRGPGARARITWRSWSTDAASDDGRLELDWSGALAGLAPVRMRLGASGDGGDRAGYGLVDIPVARDAARALSVHALRRASSTTIGARLDLHLRSGTHGFVIEGTRVKRGVASWGVALEPAGDTALRARARPGLSLAARGETGPRAFRVGYAIERVEDSSGPRPWSGSLWLRR